MRDDDQRAAAVALAALSAVIAACWLSSAGPPPASCLRKLQADWLPAGTLTGVTMQVPLELRTKNYAGGSCVHASTITMLKYNRHYAAARWYRSQYRGGEYADRLIRRMEAAGLRYAYTRSGDFEFLKWATRTRRGAGIFYKPRHAINFVGYDAEYAYLLDNNRVDTIERVPLETFKRLWRGRYGGFAWTLVYQPPPPPAYVEAHHARRILACRDRPIDPVAYRRRLVSERASQAA